MNRISHLLLLLTILISNVSYGQIARGNGVLKSETRTYSDFTEVVAIGNFDLYLLKGDAEGLRIDTDENLVPFFRTWTEGNTLFVEMSAQVRKFKDMSVYLSIDKIEKLTVLGSIRLTSEKPITFDDLNITCGDLSIIELDLTANKLGVNLYDAGVAILKGSSKELDLVANDESALDAFGLTTNNCSLKSSGYSEVKINVAKDLKIQTTGQSNVIYTGDGSISKRVFSSTGFVVKRKISATPVATE